MAAASKTTPLSCRLLVQARRPQTSSCPTLAPQRRCLHAAGTRGIHSTRQPASAAPLLLPNGQGAPDVFLRHDNVPHSLSSRATNDSPLSKVPLGILFRSLVVQHASSIPFLFKPSVATLSFLADSKSPLFSPKRNPLLKKLLRVCLYDMFCAGENGSQVTRTTRSLQSWGVQGVILSWAREFVFKQGTSKREAASQAESTDAQAVGKKAIEEWGAGNLRGVELANSGDIIALKLSGAGPTVLHSLQTPGQPFDELFIDYVNRICTLAKSKNVSLCVDAEQQRLQAGIDALSMVLSRQYNGSTPGSAVIKNTYQAYLKHIPAKLSEDLATAAREGFCLGVKLVRGAYLQTEERSIIWDTKEDTDTAFDGLMEGVMRREWNAGGYLSGSGEFPVVDFVLATHNLPSVQKACAIRLDQIQNNETPVPLTFAQLMGMADHVTAAAIKATQDEAAQAERDALIASHSNQLPKHVEPPLVFKYLAWGTVDECLRYLVRRAEENKDAAMRTQESRQVLWEEFKRRVWA